MISLCLPLEGESPVVAKECNKNKVARVLGTPSASIRHRHAQHTLKLLPFTVLIADTNEKTGARELEVALKPLLKFHCTFQVVPDALLGFDMSRTQKYDAIVMPQSVTTPFGAATLFDILQAADGCAPPFVFLIGRDEVPKRIKGCVSKFVRYTQAGNIPLHELSMTLTSCIMRDAAMAEAYPLAQLVAPVVAEVTPEAQRNTHLPQLTMKVPGRQAKSGHAEAVPRPALLAELPRRQPERNSRKRSKLRHEPDATSDEEICAGPSPRTRMRTQGCRWAMMQSQAAQQYQQRFGPSAKQNRAAAALPFSPESDDDDEDPPASPRSPPLTAFLSRRATQRSASDLGLGLNSRGVTEVDPELLRILDASTASSLLHNDVGSLRDVFNE
jgi:hypothetical protein